MSSAQKVVLSDIRRAVLEYDAEEGCRLVGEALKQGIDPQTVLHEGLLKELQGFGDRYAKGELFIIDLVSAGKVVEDAMQILMPELDKSGASASTIGKMLIGTVEGDIHDIGKNIVSAVMRANGFDVADLGKDVPTERFIEAVKEKKPDTLGASALLTTTIPRQEEIIARLKSVGLRGKVKVMIGGSACSQAWADKIGADAYGSDGVDTVNKAKQLLGLQSKT